MVIPSINCLDFKTATSHIRKAEEFSEWVHIDVSDGKFSDTISWGNPEELKSLETKLNVEVHLMVQNPEDVIQSWLKAGAKRIIVHLQTIRDIRFIIDICKKYNAIAMLSFDPSISIESGASYFNVFDSFQVLSVLPGLSGQEFEKNSADKVKALRECVPTATIEVDGGINELTGKLVKDAGADILVSGNYIFGSPDPVGAYEKLKALYENFE